MQEHLAGETPLNELEQKLFQMWNGELSREDFLRALLMSNVFILVDGEPDGDSLGDKRPMVISTAPDQPKMIALFTAAERGERMTQQFTDYNFPILVDFYWVLKAIGPSLGVALNPGWAIGLEIAAEGAQQLKAALDDAMARAGES